MPNPQVKQGQRQNNHKSNIKNKNKGSNGTNRTYDKAQGNRGKQMKQNGIG